MSDRRHGDGITGIALPARPFFAGLAADHAAALRAVAAPASYRAGARIFAEGGRADRFWLLEAGSVALDLQVPGRGAVVLETLPAGTVLGWSWLQPPYRWHFGAVARSAVESLRFDAPAVLRLCESEPSFGYAVMKLFVPVVIDRLQAGRLRLLDLYGPPGRREARP
ncbi:hypothetical protein Asp14428_07910 [Actinoplanes sp. NBRC 14428]|uniref:Cyclic nucleotide-binding domain-containing protein n=1 Tax=Pseudosporangium ferrugineum TaxID=439699 RepID=A0A2T0RKC5_9ACTN|nr:cyclic nucleotide-binding domain-containing protein [Pseudosporangium ferrugineum]PRY21608.1 Cyclic nucleotide-binding domain-containing protein [Pseudosporangium ferrugineum]BCJ49316.1 hypothetical protein Asp14428_07910 [Actinoplanes sp. NBRC 14428]